MKPIKGQILVTERMAPRLRYATHVVRQTAEGTVMIGDSHEDVGFDTTSTTPVMTKIAAQAVRMFPFLKDLRVVRSWAALRVMSEDGLPIYQESESHPGAFTVNCHSGVTLAAAHARALAPMIAKGTDLSPSSTPSPPAASTGEHMPRRIDEAAGPALAFTFDGDRIEARAGDTIAAALFAAGRRSLRDTPVSGTARGPFCMMGVCYDCLVEIDGAPNRQACMVEAADGMTVCRQSGAVPSGTPEELLA